MGLYILLYAFPKIAGNKYPRNISSQERSTDLTEKKFWRPQALEEGWGRGAGLPRRTGSTTVYETGGMAPGDPTQILFDDDEPALYIISTEGTCPCYRENALDIDSFFGLSVIPPSESRFLGLLREISVQLYLRQSQFLQRLQCRFR